MMHRDRTGRVSLLHTAGLLLALATCGPVLASSVRELAFEEVVSLSALVFEGQVLGRETRQLRDGSIHTFVRFRVLEVIKGSYAGEEIELSFLGGSIGGRTLQVSDLHMPGLDESGIYFVESLTQAQVHPLVGWDQGHFLLAAQSGGAAIVTTAEHLPVVALDAGAAPQAMSLSTGVAKGVMVRSGRGAAAALSRPMSVDEFKQSVREIVTQAQ